jgi:hypothetical protein
MSRLRPAWLHGVAHRVALKARSVRFRQLRKAQPFTASPVDPGCDPLAHAFAQTCGQQDIAVVILRRPSTPLRAPSIGTLVFFARAYHRFRRERVQVPTQKAVLAVIRPS